MKAQVAVMVREGVREVENSGRLRRFLRRAKNFHNHTILFQYGRVIFVTYGLIAASAFLVGTLAAVGYFQLIGHNATILLQFSIVVLLPAVLLGARGFSIFLEWRQLLREPLKTLAKPGYMLHGGVFGGAIAIVGYGLTFGLNPLAVADAWAFALPLGESVARIGCHVYGCCWGKPTCGNWGIRYTSEEAKVVRCAPHLAGQRLYPAQLFGSAAYLLLFGVFASVLAFIPYQGMVTGLYLVCHPVIRIGLETFRQDDRGTLWGPITHTQFYAAVQFSLGLFLLIGSANWGQLVSLNGDGIRVPFLGFETVGELSGIFLLAALAFGVHIDKVGNWYGQGAESELQRDGPRGGLAPVSFDGTLGERVYSRASGHDAG